MLGDRLSSNYLQCWERCPIHGNYTCECHRPRKQKKNDFRKTGPVVRQIDTNHPRGFREICSEGELHRRKLELLHEKPRCYLDGLPIVRYRDAQLEHIEPAGMFGANRDDHRENLELAHKWCNIRKGSIRLTEPRCATCGVLRSPHFEGAQGEPAVVTDHEFKEPITDVDAQEPQSTEAGRPDCGPDVTQFPPHQIAVPPGFEQSGETNQSHADGSESQPEGVKRDHYVN